MYFRYMTWILIFNDKVVIKRSSLVANGAWTADRSTKSAAFFGGERGLGPGRIRKSTFFSANSCSANVPHPDSLAFSQSNAGCRDALISRISPRETEDWHSTNKGHCDNSVHVLVDASP